MSELLAVPAVLEVSVLHGDFGAQYRAYDFHLSTLNLIVTDLGP